MNTEVEQAFEYLSQKGIVCYEKSQIGAAERLIKLAYYLAPEHPQINSNLGLIYMESGHIDEAIKYLETSYEKEDNAKVSGNLGAAYMQKGDMNTAGGYLNHAIELDPDYDMALSNMGHVYRSHGQNEKSLQVYTKAYEVNPDNPVYIMNIANALAGMGNLHEAKEWLEFGLERDEYPEYYNNLGNVLNKLGETRAAVQCYQKMLDEKPNISAACNKVLVNLYDVTTTPESQKKLAEDTMSILKDVPRLEISEYGHTQPRIGFISAHFGKHPVGFFTLGLFKGNRELPYYVYSNRHDEDEITEQVKENTIFRNIHGLKDGEICDMIQKDEIDILVDCGGLSGKNQILIHKMKPAPVQIGWVGYAGTRGLPEIDYLISDHVHTPEGA